MYKACIFDLDGTVADTLNTIAHFGNLALEKFSLPKIDTERYRFLAGNGAEKLIKRMINEAGGNPENFDEMLDYYMSEYDKDHMYKTTVYTGMRELLDEIKGRGIKLGVLSNKPHHTVQNVCASLFGEGFFNVCRGLCEGSPAKPDPLVFGEIIQEMGVCENECII